jgi:ABC-type phosphate/phosphonate transport system permease subunit
MRRTSVTTLLFALVFGILATWLGPKLIGWYVTPADQPAMLSCNAAVVGAMHRLVLTQLWGTVIGAVVGLIVGIVMRPKVVMPPPPAKTA